MTAPTDDNRLDRVLEQNNAMLLRLTAIEYQISGHGTTTLDHETRLRAVERIVWSAPASLTASVIAAVTAVGTALVAALGGR